MKNFIVMFLLSFLGNGVFGADEMKKEVTEGDQLTLPTGLTEARNDLIYWLYGSDQTIIAEISNGNFQTHDDRADGIFKGKLELDKKTGSLTIKDIRIKNSGDYKLDINRGVTSIKFSVTVYAPLPTPAIGFSECAQTPAGSSSKICVVQCSVQTVGLVTLSWYKGNNLVSNRISDTCSSTSLRLEVDYDDKNAYSCMVNNPISNQTKHLDISGLCQSCAAVPNSGYSDGAVAGIVVGVLLLAAAAAGVMYYRRPRTTNLPNQTWSVTEGDPVTLNPDTEIQRGDEIQWMFRDTLIAEIKGENREKTTPEGPDQIFKNRLKQGETTGSLTITDIRTAHTGLYTLKIRRGRETFYKRFHVSVREREITVMEGKSVTLEPAYEINKDDLIYWLFGDKEQKTGIAELKVETGEILPYDFVAGGRFRDRLQLDKTTGSLTIKNTRTEHSGVYKLEITSSSGVSEQTFIVTVRVEEKLLKEDFVTLKPDPEIQRDDQILWMFGDQDKLIAQMKGGTVDIYDDVNKRFRGRLKLDEKTGSLTITKIEAEHTGLYKLQIISSNGETLYKRFMVLIKLRYETVTAGKPVHLYTEHPEIQTADEIQWLFGDENSLIAEIKGTGKTYDGPDERFRDRLELNETTGDLIIKNCTYEHAGRYKLKIRTSEGNTNRTYIVIIRYALATKEAREKSLMKEKNEKRVNESATIVMPLLDGEDLNVVNEERTSAL